MFAAFRRFVVFIVFCVLTLNVPQYLRCCHVFLIVFHKLDEEKLVEKPDVEMLTFFNCLCLLSHSQLLQGPGMVTKWRADYWGLLVFGASFLSF